MKPIVVIMAMSLVLSGVAQYLNTDPGYSLVAFESQGITLRGRLYLPDETENARPVIVMAHGFTTTINGMTADKYALRFREAGFCVLLFDHANLGISDGQPRQEINFWIQTRGYLDAIEFISAQPETKTRPIAVWGASLSSREAFLAGIIDSRVDAVIAMIPAFGENIPRADTDGRFLAFAERTLSSADIRALPQTKTPQMPVVSADQTGTPSALTELTAFRWFMEYGGRFGTNWQNVVSFSSVESPEHFNPAQLGPYLKVPILMIVARNDEMHGANPEVTQYVYRTISQPKAWVNVNGGHFGLLHYPSPEFDISSRAQIDFLNRHLN